MFSTIKKMIHKKKPEDKKPILDIEKNSNNFNFKEEPSEEDYSLPEPGDIGRLPLPETSKKEASMTDTISPFSSPVERERKERIDNFRKMREESKKISFEPPPVKPLHEYPPRTIEPASVNIQKPMERDISREILNRLEAIERRLSRIEQTIKIPTEDNQRY